MANIYHFHYLTFFSQHYWLLKRSGILKRFEIYEHGDEEFRDLYRKYSEERIIYAFVCICIVELYFEIF